MPKNTRRHNLERPVRMTKRKPKRKKQSNGVHPPNRGHGSQGHTRQTAPSTDPMEQAPSNRPFRDLASAALTARGSNGQTEHLSPLEAAKARRARAEAEGSLPGGTPVPRAQQPQHSFLSADEKLLLSDLTSALREHTDTLREVNGLGAIDRSEDAATFIPPAAEADDGQVEEEAEDEEAEEAEDEEADEEATGSGEDGFRA